LIHIEHREKALKKVVGEFIHNIELNKSSYDV
jgi:hypothetical protein